MAIDDFHTITDFHTFTVDFHTITVDFHTITFDFHTITFVENEKNLKKTHRLAFGESLISNSNRVKIAAETPVLCGFQK